MPCFCSYYKATALQTSLADILQSTHQSVLALALHRIIVQGGPEHSCVPPYALGTLYFQKTVLQVSWLRLPNMVIYPPLRRSINIASKGERPHKQKSKLCAEGRPPLSQNIGWLIGNFLRCINRIYDADASQRRALPDSNICV